MSTHLLSLMFWSWCLHCYFLLLDTICAMHASVFAIHVFASVLKLAFEPCWSGSVFTFMLTWLFLHHDFVLNLLEFHSVCFWHATSEPLLALQMIWPSDHLAPSPCIWFPESVLPMFWWVIILDPRIRFLAMFCKLYFQILPLVFLADSGMCDVLALCYFIFAPSPFPCSVLLVLLITCFKCVK